MAQKYRIHFFVQGSPVRPCYDGCVDVIAESAEDAIYTAKRQLLRGSFFDARIDDFKTRSIELLPSGGIYESMD